MAQVKRAYLHICKARDKQELHNSIQLQLKNKPILLEYSDNNLGAKTCFIPDLKKNTP